MPHCKKRYIFHCILILFLLTGLFFPSLIRAEQQAQKIQVVYFHGNLCEQCDEEFKFKSMFYLKTGDEADGVEIEITLYNIFEGNGDQKLEEYYKKYDVPQDEQAIPAVFIGNSYLMGDEAIENGIKDLFVKAKAGSGAVRASSAKTNKTLLVYFYLTSCSECEKAAGLMSNLKDKYQVVSEGKSIETDVEIVRFNISKAENIMIARQYFEFYNVPDKERKVPILFMGNTYLSGEKAIQEKLAANIKSGLGLATPRLNIGKGIPDEALTGLSWGGILGALLAGLVNGINPCSMSMLLFFLSMLLLKGINILKAGFAFIAGKFMSYLLLGFLLYDLLSNLNMVWIQTAIKIALIAVIVVLIILNAQDFFAAKSEKYNKIRLQLPTFLRKFNHKWIKKITEIKNTRVLLLVCFGTGVIISAGEFLCTGQIYLASIMYMLQSSITVNIQALILFLVYAAAFVIPLVVLTVFVHKGKEIFDISEVIRGKMHVIKLINIIVFILIGIFVLLRF